MTIRIQTQSGQPIEYGLKSIFTRILDSISRNFSGIASNTMTSSVKSWVQKRYPNSKHWDPNKVTNGKSIGLTGTTNVDIEGAGRAYHDVIIRPVRAKMLTIPMHSDAFHHSARDFNDLFKPKGKNILARNVNGNLVAMFALAKSAFQKQDSSLMPTDDNLASGIFKALCQKL